MPDQRPGVALCWYYHLPTVCTAEEIADLARHSIAPLLNAHEKSGQPFALTITGTLLERLTSIRPDIIDRIGDLHSRNLCEIGASCFHEVHPGMIPLNHLALQVQRDVELKQTVFGMSPSLFFPPNYVWVGAFEPLLRQMHLTATILDAAHYRLAVSPQSWRWASTDLSQVSSGLLDPGVDPRETRRVVQYQSMGPTQEGAAARQLRCFFRDNELVARFSFGNSGLIHHADDRSALLSFVGEMRAAFDEGNLVTIADDGDRVNAVSLYAYESFLELVGEDQCRLPSAYAPCARGPRLEYLPSFALAGFDDLLCSGSDSRHYLALLNEVFRHPSLSPEAEAELLALEDVFFLFWKTLPRKRSYLERLLKLHADVQYPEGREPIG